MSKVLPTAAVCGGNSKTFVFYSGFWLKKRRFPDFILCKVHAQNNPSGPFFKHHWCGVIKVSLMMTAPCTGLMKVKDNRSFSRCLFFSSCTSQWTTLWFLVESDSQSRCVTSSPSPIPLIHPVHLAVSSTSPSPAPRRLRSPTPVPNPARV